MYTFRVLNKYEKDVESNGLTSKVHTDTNKLVKDALLSVSSHIQNGSNKDSSWISTTRSLSLGLEHYGIPYDDMETRTSLAVIKNHDKVSTNLDIFSKIGNQKIIIDLSSDCGLLESMNNFLICFNNKFYVSKDILKKYDSKIKVKDTITLKSNTTGDIIQAYASSYIKSTPGTKYSRRSKEIIVLNNIPKEDIVRVLNPLEMDILYAISKYCEINCISFDIDNFIDEQLYDLDKLNINYDGNILYNELYVKNRFTTDIVKEIYEKNNDKQIDVLELYSYIKNFKRNIINNYLIALNYKIGFIPLVDDYVHIIRMGNVNTNKLNSIKIDNKSISLKKLTFDSSMELNKEVRKTLTYLFKYEDSNELYGLSNKNGYDIITNDIDKKLELDKEKVISLSKKIEVK